MPHTKKPKLANDVANTVAMPLSSSRFSSTRIAGHINASLNDLSADELANILGCLGPDEIMRIRRVCHKWSEAVKKTTVPLTKFRVNDAKSYNAMIAMTTALPNLQQIELGCLSYDFRNRISHRYLHGEDPDEEKARGSDAANDVVHELDAISSFTKLRILELSSTPLNGKYHCLFNFPFLQKLTVFRCPHLKWDLDMLSGFPLLKELDCSANRGGMTGNIQSLRVLKDTLEKVEIVACRQVRGSFMEFADFPRLKSLILRETASITGDIRDIGEHDFPKLEVFHLPESVYGGDRYNIMRITDAKELIAAVYSLKKQRHRHPSLFEKFNWYLSENSPDWYREQSLFDWEEFMPMAFPFSFCIVRAGSRLGWRWERNFDYPDYHFEVNWLDPLPDKKSNEYGSYIQALQEIESDMNKFPFFRGYREPPTEAVFHRLNRQYRPSREEMEIWENM